MPVKRSCVCMPFCETFVSVFRKRCAYRFIPYERVYIRNSLTFTYKNVHFSRSMAASIGLTVRSHYSRALRAITSPTQSNFRRAASPPLIAENTHDCPLRELAGQCQLQMSPISQPTVGYATSTPHRHDDGIYRASIALRGKNTPNSNLADLYSKQDISAIFSLKL